SRLLIERLGELLVPCFQLLEQPDVLDRDHGLVGEGLKHLNLFLGERLCVRSSDLYAPDADTLAQQWYAKDCPVPESPCEGTSFPKLFDLLLKVCHMNQPPLEHRATCHRSADHGERELSDG